MPCFNHKTFNRLLKSPCGAVFSSNRRYRYALWRRWDEGSRWLAVVGLNPSMADENDNDPTIRRCIGFAQSWGYAGVCVVNLFAWCATRPVDLRRAADPVGEHNDIWVESVTGMAVKTLAAWGNHGLWQNRDQQILNLIGPMVCLGQTQQGAPLHPLYIKADTTPVTYR